MASGRVDAILDEAIVGHVGYVIDSQPYVTPTCIWRTGDRLYWHGSSASRMLRATKDGAPVCVTVSLLDRLVLARSGFDHSVDYRSVMVLGRAYAVEDSPRSWRPGAFVDTSPGAGRARPATLGAEGDERG
jgi:nitroimidazol reductase NimA-like FMN-containing flavoprotein (pyridoxamine 5'-phosphate oxidase superfamily)